MPAMIGVRAMELLISRLCHDLVGPVGAINNGVELIEESGLAGSEDAFDLVSESAEIASRRLKMFRLAFGAAGAQDTLGLGDIRAVIEGWFRGGKVRFVWSAASFPETPRGFMKVLLCAVLLADEAMPQGGALTLTAGSGGVRLAGEGRAASVREEVRTALEGGSVEDDLTPRAVLGYAAGRIADAYGLGLAIEAEEPGRVAIRVLPQSGAPLV